MAVLLILNRFLSKRSLLGFNISIFMECKIPKRECFPYIFKIFCKKAWGNNIPQIKKRPANKHCTEFFRIFAQDMLHLSN